MTEQQTPPPTSSAPSIGKPEAPKLPADKQPPWGAKPENFDPDKAWEMIQNLRVEKSDPAFRQEFDSWRQQQTAQRDALAAALGVKPEETSDTDKLASQIESLRGQIVSSERRALAIEHGVPETLLTAADAEGMRAQAQALKEFAEAAHYAASTAAPPTPPPAFAPNPGQGQGGGATPEAQAAAEYEKYYPSSK